MSKHLFFIPLIAQALEQPDARSALHTAFTKIRQLGRHKKYRRGFSQFMRFMEMVVEHADRQTYPINELGIESILANLEIEGNEPDDELSTIRLPRQWQSQFEISQGPFSELIETHDALELSVFRNGQRIGTIVILPNTGSATLEGILPGKYCLKLPTGRVLWEAELTPHDLVWTTAFPGRPLEMAAVSEAIQPETTRQELLLDGEMQLRVMPGVESGRLVIDVKDTGVW